LDKRRKNTYHEVLLEPDQYSAFWEKPPNDHNLMALKNPLISKNYQKWAETYEIANNIMSETVEDFSEEATFYHDISISEQVFFERINLNLKFIKQIDRLSFYK